MHNELNTIQIKLVETLQESIKANSFNSYNLQIFCANLDEKHLVEDIRNSKEFGKTFKDLQSFNGPVLYWISILSNHTHEEIRNALSTYKSTKNARASSAMHKYTVENSRYLYVGKVKSNFWGRVIQHLGYNKSNQTSSLQLFHWAKDIGLKIEIHAIQFIPEMADLMGLIELKLAQELHPIIGKHK